MKIHLGQLVSAEPALNRIAAERTTAQTRYDVAKLVARVRTEIAHFQIERQKLFRELGVEREANEAERAAGQQGPMFEVAHLHMGTFQQRILELAAVEVEIADGLLTPAMLEPIPLSPDDILALGMLIAS